MENEEADAGRDGRTHLARPNSQARARTGKKYFPCSADHEQDWQPYLVDPYSAICDDHTQREAYLVTLTDRCSFLWVSGQRGTIAKSMYEKHLCVVALTSIERGTQFFPLASYFRV